MIGVIMFLLMWCCAILAAISILTYTRGDAASLSAGVFYCIATAILAIQSATIEISDAIRKVGREMKEEK